MLIHGTDVSASYSQLPINQLDSLSEVKIGANGLPQGSKSSHTSLAQGLTTPVDKIQRLAASLKAKDICNGEGDMLIVGGGEIDMMGSSDEDH